MKDINSPRILARTLIVEKDKALLVRNKGEDFWYLPGGGWEHNKETIVECAAREVMEETGYKIEIKRMLWLQEFHSTHQIFFETFWLANITGDNQQDLKGLANHIDSDPEGMVEEAKWYTQEQLAGLTVYPPRVKNFLNIITPSGTLHDPFIGSV